MENDWLLISLLSLDPIVSRLSPALTNLPQLSFPAVLSLVAPSIPCASESFGISHLRCSGEDILQSDKEVNQKRVSSLLTISCEDFHPDYTCRHCKIWI